MRRKGHCTAVALLVVLLATSCGLAAAGPTASSHRPAALGLSLTAVPVGGNAPFVFELRATLDPGSERGAFDWNFGDGVTFDQNATGYSAVSHEYRAAGNYTAAVYVQSAAGDGNATVAIAVTSSPLSAGIVATPTSGTAPLTVRFEADPVGGSGTYIAFLWKFGDGDSGSGADLSYTYSKAGTFNASVLLTDTTGKNATSSIEIIVQPGAPPGTPSTSSSVPPYAELVIPTFVILAIAALAAVLYFRYTVRRTATAAEVARAPEGATLNFAPAPSASSFSGPSSPEEMADATSSRAGVEDTQSLSERILVHLYWYGRTTLDGVAREDASQAGMARRLGVGQNSLSKALRRLVDAGALKVELQHVPGASRRLKTYSLTARGEAVARRIRADVERRPKL